MVLFGGVLVCSDRDLAQKNIPKVGKRVNTSKGTGKVIRQNLLKETLTVLLDSGEEEEISKSDIISDKERSNQ